MPSILRSVVVSTIASSLLGCSGCHTGNLAPPTSTPIQHVVVIMQENRSFDHLFNGFPGADTVSSGMNQGVVVPLTVTPLGTVATPTFTPVPGNYSSAQSVTIKDSTAGASIFYTTNGTAPTTGSTKYSGTVTVSSTETIQAIAVLAGYINSAVATAAYTIK